MVLPLLCHQIAAEVRAAVCLPTNHWLTPLLAWRKDISGNVVAASLYAGPTVEQLLQRPAAQGGWLGLPVHELVEVCRMVLAGVLKALEVMSPMVRECCSEARHCWHLVHMPGQV